MSTNSQSDAVPANDGSQPSAEQSDVEEPTRSAAESEEDLDEDDRLDAEEIKSARAALLRYRVMAYLVGAMLVVLVCIGMPLKYIWGDGRLVFWTGMPHGWLYPVLLITAFDVGRRVNWPLKYLLGIMLAGTVPFLSFVAEHFATKDVRRRLAEAEANLG